MPYKDIAVRRACQNRHYHATKAQKREDRLKHLYGLTTEEYLFFVSTTNSRCMICKVELEQPVVDHNHITNRFRGLLCQACNVGLGGFHDNPENLEAAIYYLSHNFETIEVS